MRRTSASSGGNGNKSARRRSRAKNRFKSGDWNAISDFSGQKFKASDGMFTWQNFFVHKSEWEPKQPQLDLRGRDENIAVPYSRPRQDDVFFVPTADDL
jgi:hypothetical protein